MHFRVRGIPCITIKTESVARRWRLALQNTMSLTFPLSLRASQTPHLKPANPAGQHVSSVLSPRTPTHSEGAPVKQTPTPNIEQRRQEPFPSGKKCGLSS